MPAPSDTKQEQQEPLERLEDPAAIARVVSLLLRFREAAAARADQPDDLGAELTAQAA
jgi:hypothetical protein